MTWDDNDRAALLSFKNTIDCDDIKVKEDIKKMLLNNRFIVHVLNNEALEADDDTEPEDYFGVNILPYYMVPTTVTDAKVFLCYEVNYDELEKYNSSMKLLQIVFHILCYKEMIMDDETNVARHDLLAGLILDQFNLNPNFRGGRFKCVSDVAGTTDSDYATRTLTLEQVTDNNLVKTKNNVARFINKDAPEKWGE